MMEQMTWKEVYTLWKRQAMRNSIELNKPISAERIYVPCYQRSCYIYGYDWLENATAQHRKELLSSDPVNFIFMKSSNNGTIQTAEMLIDAKDEEERAAIWIAATTFEIKSLPYGALMRYATLMNDAACEFLRQRYYLWHHAMKKLVPEIMLPWRIMEKLTDIDAALMMDLIQTNTLLLKGHYSIHRYSSLDNSEKPSDYQSHRKDE